MRLSLVPFEERRETNLWFDIFIDVRKYGWEGVYKMQKEKWRAVLKQGDKKRYEKKGALNNSDNDKQLELRE